MSDSGYLYQSTDLLHNASTSVYKATQAWRRSTATLGIGSQSSASELAAITLRRARLTLASTTKLDLTLPSPAPNAASFYVSDDFNPFRRVNDGTITSNVPGYFQVVVDVHPTSGMTPPGGEGPMAQGTPAKLISPTNSLLISGSGRVSVKQLHEEQMIGEIRMWPQTSVPSNWLRCDGAQYPRILYPKLFLALGGATGANPYGYDATYFNVPDFRSRIPVMPGAYLTIGQTELSDDADRPLRWSHSHNHGVGTLDTSNVDLNRQTNTTTGGGAARLAPTGTNHNHNITGSVAAGGSLAHPVIGIYFIIRADVNTSTYL